MEEYRKWEERLLCFHAGIKVNNPYSPSPFTPPH
jgi:hypothetical protein